MPAVDKSVTVLAFTTWEPVRVPKVRAGTFEDKNYGRAEQGLEIQKVYDGIRVRETGAATWARIYSSNLRDCHEADAEAASAEPTEATGERKSRR